MLTVMIVDDAIEFRGIVRGALLSQFPSMEVFEAGSGEEAFRILAAHPIDLIFMDVRLPGENGLELTRKVKASHQDITVIVVTSFDLPEYREAAIQCGASAFIAKDSFDAGKASASIRCHQEAKRDGRMASGSEKSSGECWRS